MRGHYRAPIQDADGNLLAGSVVSIFQNGSTNPPNGAGTLLGLPVYSDGTSQATLPNPFTTLDGNVSFYLDVPQRVDLGVQPPGGMLVIYPDIDVETAATSSAALTFAGTGPSSTAVGASAVATQAQAVALGDTSSATGQQSLAVGQQSGAAAQGATAVGQLASAAGAGAVAVGQAASASGAQGVAIGQGSGVIGGQSVALGAGASAPGTGSVAIGPGAQANLPNQVVLGTLPADIVIAGGLVYSQSPPQALVNGAAITVSGTASASIPVTAAANVSALQISNAGAVPGQTVVINNESAFTLTFDVPANSNVADGTSDVIAANAARQFIFDGNVNLWYRVT